MTSIITVGFICVKRVNADCTLRFFGDSKEHVNMLHVNKDCATALGMSGRPA